MVIIVKPSIHVYELFLRCTLELVGVVNIHVPRAGGDRDDGGREARRERGWGVGNCGMVFSVL